MKNKILSLYACLSVNNAEEKKIAYDNLKSLDENKTVEDIQYEDAESKLRKCIGSFNAKINFLKSFRKMAGVFMDLSARAGLMLKKCFNSVFFECTITKDDSKTIEINQISAFRRKSSSSDNDYTETSGGDITNTFRLQHVLENIKQDELPEKQGETVAENNSNVPQNLFGKENFIKLECLNVQKENKDSRNMINQRIGSPAKTEPFFINDLQKSLLFAMHIQSKNASDFKDNCILIGKNGMFFSAFQFQMFFVKLEGTKQWSIVVLSETGEEKIFHGLKNLPKETAIHISENILDVAKQIGEIDDLIDSLINNYQAIHNEKNEELFKISRNLENCETESESESEVGSTISKTNTDNHCDKEIADKSSYVKQQYRQPTIDRVKMRESQLKKSIGRRESSIRKLEDLIRQLMFHFFEGDIDMNLEKQFERPHVLWPAMHPLLQYKIRYLDEEWHGDSTISGSQKDHTDKENSRNTSFGDSESDSVFEYTDSESPADEE